LYSKWGYLYFYFNIIPYGTHDYNPIFLTPTVFKICPISREEWLIMVVHESHGGDFVWLTVNKRPPYPIIELKKRTTPVPPRVVHNFYIIFLTLYYIFFTTGCVSSIDTSFVDGSTSISFAGTSTKLSLWAKLIDFTKLL
jgi:hypothetical protein